MVLEAVVDLNVLSYSIAIIMRAWGEVDRRDETSPWTLGKAKPALGGQARWSWPKGVGRGGAQPLGVGRGGV